MLWQNLGPSESALQHLAVRASGVTRSEVEHSDSGADSEQTNASMSGIEKHESVDEGLSPKSTATTELRKGEDSSKILDQLENEWVLKVTKNKPADKVYEFLFSQPLGKLR